MMPDTMIKTLIIVNKKSGVSDKKRISKSIRRSIDRDKFNYKITFTEYKGHAIKLSEDAVAKGIDCIIVVGGDGSVNEVAKSLIHTQIPLGIIPMGSGNGLARSLNIPIFTAKAIKVVNRFKPQSIDVGFINEHLFLSNAGIGFDAMVTQIFENKKARGLFGYLQTFPKAILKHRSLYYEMAVDEETISGKAFMINIANGNQMGYNFKISPKASPFDGSLNVAVIEKLTPWKLPPIVIKSFLEGQSKFVHSYHGKDLKIQSDNTIRFIQTDGEAIENNKKELQVKIEPKALNILLP